MSFGNQARLYASPKKGWHYAGKLDLLAEVDAPEYGLVGTGVMDWKSSKKPREEEGYVEWALQTSGYRRGVDQSYGLVPDWNATVRLDKFEGYPELYNHSDTYKLDVVAFGYLCKYYRNRNKNVIEGKLPSVTTICGILHKPALIQWASNCTRDFVIKKAEEELKVGEFAPAIRIIQWAEQAAKEFRQISLAEANIGAEIHNLIEVYLRTGKEPVNLKILDPRVENGWKAFMILKEKIKLRVIEIELTVYGRY